MEDMMKRAIAFLILSLVMPVMAGAQGSADGQREMGILYECGYNMPKNNATALAWYLRSAEQGNALAVKRRDQLKSRMQPDEIDAADKLSKELMTKKPETADTPPAPQAPPAEMPASSP